MRRTPIWGLLAIYPLIAIAVLTAIPSSQIDLLPLKEPDGTLARVLLYWPEALVASVLAQIGYFVIHAARNGVIRKWRRPLWIVGILFLGYLVVPVYWWLYAKP
jgi:hypothetical protein